jgi:hypothetical protein
VGGTRSQQIYSIIKLPVKYTVRKIAELTNIPKSSAQRLRQAILKRNQYPESYFWETEEGYHWLHILVYATIFLFGIKCGIGAETISQFFKVLRLSMHIAVSPTTIKDLRNRMEDILIDYKNDQETHHPREELLKIVGGADETFFEKMILVFMDLSSGYIFFEEESKDRSYTTWKEKIQQILNKFNIDFKYTVSDRAKALIKLAEKGLNCLSIPDLFHASHEIVKLFGLRLQRKKADILNKLMKALAELALLKELSKDISQQEILITQLNNEYAFIDTSIASYQSILRKLSEIVHPFDIHSSEKRTSTTVLNLLLELVEQIKALQNALGINDDKKRIEKFENQIEGISSLIDPWWLWCEESVMNDEIDNELKDWLLMYLLPRVYWQYQVNRTKNPALRQIYQKALAHAQLKLQQHPLTPLYITQKKWLSWAKQMASNFQRTSSAIEGRNGWLSQMHHNGRGLSIKRLKALTVIHNYYLKRSDGTTAAERLFNKKFTDPFEVIMNKMGDLPLPRKSKNLIDLTYCF